MIQSLLKFSAPVGGGAALLYAAMIFAVISIGVSGGAEAATNESISVQEYEHNITSAGDEVRRELSQNISNPAVEMFVMSTSMAPIDGVITAARTGIRVGFQVPWLATEVSLLSRAISYIFIGQFAIRSWRNIRGVTNDTR